MPQSDTRSLEEIKHETEVTRAELTETVAELRSNMVETSRDLRERIKPAAIKAEVGNYVRSRGEQLFDDLTDAARRNPLQAAAVCGSLAYPLYRLARTIPIPIWMVGAGLYLAKSETGRVATEKASAVASDLMDQAAHGASALRDRVSDAVAGASDRVSDVVSGASDRVSDVVAGASDAAAGLKETVTAGARAGANKTASSSEQVREAAASAGYSLREKSEQTRDQISQMAAAAVEKAMGFSENVAAAGQRAADTVRSSATDATQSARQAASSARQAVSDLGDRASKTFAETVEQNALLVAGLGLLIGAVIAGALPRTEVEDEWVGGPSRSAIRRARSAAADAVSEGIRRASRQAEAEGLDGEGVREAVHEVGERVRRVTETAVTTAFEPPEGEESEQRDVRKDQSDVQGVKKNG